MASGRVSADTALVPPDAVGDAAAVPLSGAQVANQVLLQVKLVPACSCDSVTMGTTHKHSPVLRPELAAPWKGPAHARCSGLTLVSQVALHVRTRLARRSGKGCGVEAVPCVA